MSDLQRILNKFTELGIENKGLTVDAPQQGQALQEQKSNSQSTDTTSHARMVAESIKGKHIPGISDTSASDMAALAGVGNATPQAPQYQTETPAPVQQTYNDKWHEVDSRLSKIENTLAKVFESLEGLKQMSNEEYQEKRKALQGIQLDPNTNKDPKLKKELIRRKFELEKDYKAGKITTEDTLKKGFVSFLKELESN
tara:strand:- start:5090 stop:5683 length:594 start_codon:yes stop_codon:yes gene_type:complete